VHAWVEPRVLAAQPGPAQPMLAGLDPALKKKRKKRVGQLWALGLAGPNHVY